MTRNTCTRRLVAVDLENMAGTPWIPADWSATACSYLVEALELKEHDLVYVAGAPHNATAVCAVAGALHGQARVKRGKNGADLVLLNALETTPISALESPTAPVAEVVIVSGDGIFTGVADRFRRSGYRVTVVSRPGSLHRALAAACNRVVYLSIPGQLSRSRSSQPGREAQSR
ncbi:MAG: hypothetical protein CL471_01580 [Acidobacteria bacterium]|nr:hypothetical protein [Acidobacteriota bacterium]MQG58602.1 NYN domain-containing protein [SAR202 cluster bacterium]